MGGGQSDHTRLSFFFDAILLFYFLLIFINLTFDSKILKKVKDFNILCISMWPGGHQTYMPPNNDLIEQKLIRIRDKVKTTNVCVR